MGKIFLLLILLFNINLFSQPLITNSEEIQRFDFTSVHLKYCQNQIEKSKKNAKIEAEILKYDRDGDLMFFTLMSIKPR
jgi:hypothetical protein